MQVLLTEFSSDSYALPIELRKLTGLNATAAAPALAASTSRNRDDQTLSSSPSPIEGFVSHEKQALKFHDAKHGIIGTSCLSIIGMIKPGRTVRLYRQIH